MKWEIIISTRKTIKFVYDDKEKKFENMEIIRGR